MTDFLNELQEDIQEENLFSLWRQYGKYVIASMVAILLGTGIYLLWKNNREAELSRQSMQYQTAIKLIQEKHPEQALQILDELEKTQDGYKTLAQLQKAALKTQQALATNGAQNADFLEKAFAPFTQNETKFPPLKNLALVEQAYVLLAIQQNNPAVWKAIEASLTPQHPWKGVALELITLRAFQEKKGDAVKETLDKLLYHKDVSPEIQRRIGLEAMAMGLSLQEPLSHAPEY